MTGIPDVLIGIASWIALAGFCWLLLLEFQYRYERQLRPPFAEIGPAPAPPDGPDSAQVRIPVAVDPHMPQEFPV